MTDSEAYGPGVPVARLRAAIRLLGDGEMTPTARRLLEQICDEHAPKQAPKIPTVCALHCWLRLRRHVRSGQPWKGCMYSWDRCARCGRSFVIGAEDMGPG